MELREFAYMRAGHGPYPNDNFVKMIRICLMEPRSKGFKTEKLEAELKPVLSSTEPSSLRNLAFKKYVYVALKSVEVRRAFADLLLNENITLQERNFVYDHPVLRAAILQKTLNQAREPRPTLVIVATKKKHYFDPNPIEYTFNGLRAFIEFDSYGMDISPSIKKNEIETS